MNVYNQPAHKIHFNAPAETKAVMGHTRLATQGDRKQNYNNRPFAGHADKEFAFAHNGVLWNDKDLRKEGVIPTSYNVIYRHIMGYEETYM